MQIEEQLTVAAPPEAVWQVFDDIARVARCVPGVQSVEVLGLDRYKVVATQKVGFISATFEMTTQVETREPLRVLALSSTGKSIRGAVGNLRSRDRVEFAPTPDGGTHVRLSSDLAVGGMLGALGHKAIASKTKEITEKFAQALRAEIQAATGSA